MAKCAVFLEKIVQGAAPLEPGMKNEDVKVGIIQDL